MAPSVAEIRSTSSQESKYVNGTNGVNGTKERKLGVYDDVQFDPRLKPKSYHIEGEHNALYVAEVALTSNRHQS